MLHVYVNIFICSAAYFYSLILKRKVNWIFIMVNQCRIFKSFNLLNSICNIFFQVYKNDSKSYVSHDKYFGRGLDQNGVKDEMLNFFHDGLSLRKDVIASIVTKLRQMLTALDKQSTFKLFSCSLLILYEGDANFAITSREVPSVSSLDLSSSTNDVRLIDFANAIETSSCSKEDLTSKAGIRYGIKSLVELLEDVLKANP